ncbi:hypothetical protein Sjap_020059 [Stephania japonica]|uniref:Uncharacterized protein n=1 Tax=Stephania japonica TaxID=461633 RepID=A0AAP0EZY8_9MAGN
MVDQWGPSDDSSTSSTRAVIIEEFQTLTQRVATQERQLKEILAILRASIVVASVPSKDRVIITQEESTPGVTTVTLLLTTTAMRPVMAVVPRALTEIAPATPIVYGTTATIERWPETKDETFLFFSLCLCYLPSRLSPSLLLALPPCIDSHHLPHGTAISTTHRRRLGAAVAGGTVPGQG